LGGVVGDAEQALPATSPLICERESCCECGNGSEKNGRK